MSSDNKYMSFKVRYSNPEYKKKFNDKYNQTQQCECGSMVTGLNYKRHLISKKHLSVMNIINALKLQHTI